jgi:hypothetical protein
MAETHIATSGPTAPVPKEPKPSVDRIDELARRILTGDILLPKFQRNFVWDRVQIRTLLDSRMRLRSSSTSRASTPLERRTRTT